MIRSRERNIILDIVFFRVVIIIMVYIMPSTEIKAKAPIYLTKSISKRNSDGLGKRIAWISSPLAVFTPLQQYNLNVYLYIYVCVLKINKKLPVLRTNALTFFDEPDFRVWMTWVPLNRICFLCSLKFSLIWLLLFNENIPIPIFVIGTPWI